MEQLKKIVGFVFFFTFIVTYINAQSPEYLRKLAERKDCFVEGDWFISAGMGPSFKLKTFILETTNDVSFVNKKEFGVLHLKGEYALKDWIGIGLVSNIIQLKGSVRDTRNIINEVDYTSVALSVRGNLHFATDQKLDMFIGVGAGIKYSTLKYINNNANNTKPPFNYLPVSLELTLGLRYFPIDGVGFYSEVGPAKSVVQFGMIVSINALK